MIIEGLMITTGEDDVPHVAPMGPVVDEQLEQWLLRPYQNSTTFKNLFRTGQGVFQVVDDVLPIVQAALKLPSETSVYQTACGHWVCGSTCRWFALKIRQWDTAQLRAEGQASVTESGEIRPFWGWNRAKHAILEATILATRLHLTGRDPVLDELDKLAVVVEKTAGVREARAWNLVHSYIRQWKS